MFNWAADDAGQRMPGLVTRFGSPFLVDSDLAPDLLLTVNLLLTRRISSE